jgi:hypothetical protein
MKKKQTTCPTCHCALDIDGVGAVCTICGNAVYPPMLDTRTYLRAKIYFWACAFATGFMLALIITVCYLKLR